MFVSSPNLLIQCYFGGGLKMIHQIPHLWYRLIGGICLVVIIFLCLLTKEWYKRVTVGTVGIGCYISLFSFKYMVSSYIAYSFEFFFTDSFYWWVTYIPIRSAYHTVKLSPLNLTQQALGFVAAEKKKWRVKRSHLRFRSPVKEATSVIKSFIPCYIDSM